MVSIEPTFISTNIHSRTQIPRIGGLSVWGQGKAAGPERLFRDIARATCAGIEVDARTLRQA